MMPQRRTIHSARSRRSGPTAGTAVEGPLAETLPTPSGPIAARVAARGETVPAAFGQAAQPRLDALNTIIEVAAFVKVSTRTVQRAIADGKLEALRAGVGVRITEQAVWAWLSGPRAAHDLSSPSPEREETP